MFTWWHIEVEVKHFFLLLRATLNYIPLKIRLNAVKYGFYSEADPHILYGTYISNRDPPPSACTRIKARSIGLPRGRH